MQSKLMASWSAWVGAALVCYVLLLCTRRLHADPVSGVVQVEFKLSAPYDMACHSPKADKESKVKNCLKNLSLMTHLSQALPLLYDHIAVLWLQGYHTVVICIDRCLQSL